MGGASDTLVLGIDLGTTNSVVAVADEQSVRVLETENGEALIPSTVTFHPDGTVLVGASARERRLLDAANTVYSVKRLIGRPYESDEVRRAQSRFAFEFVPSSSGGVLVKARKETYTLSEISAFVLREVRAVAERALGHRCTRAVVTVPANFNELQRSATKAAGRVAGLEVIRILNEPTAAALAYGYGHGVRERVAVFDLGGGTFDVTVLELAGEIFEVQATAGDTYLGGDDIDNLIAEQMAEAFLVEHRVDMRSDRASYERLRAAAEWAKCQLSVQPEVVVHVDELAYGIGGVPLNLGYKLSAKALEAMSMPLLARAFDVCEEALRIASVTPAQIDRVILVGGSTRMPLVRRMVTEYFGREPLGNIDPDLVVAQGAAIQARSLATSRAKGRIGRVALRRAAPPSQLVAQEVSGAKHVDATGLSLGADNDFAFAKSVAPRSASVPPTRVGAPPGATMRPPGAPALPPALPPAPSPELRMPVPSEENTGLPPVLVQAAVIVDAPPLLDLGDFSVLDGDELGLMDEPEPLPELFGHVEDARPPLLVDVTPLSLGVETVGGYCETVIARNATIPTEQGRAFATGRGDQQEVVLRICQGESRRLEENQLLGEVTLTLSGVTDRPRPIEVSFLLDANGTLAVRAVDESTGEEQQASIQLVGGIDESETEQFAERLEATYRES
ncbi:MAG: molecular chaperone DnaK [Polyangiales bacterium]|jgi:molecular chaperone DnaK